MSDSSTTATATAPAEPTLADDAPHLLIIDDDSRIRTLLARYLGGNGFRITAAGDAAEARRRLGGLSFDLLIVDVMMPGEDGIALVRSLRQTMNVPVLMLTARSEADARIPGLESGADDYLGKPFEPRELLLRIQSVLRRRRPAATADAPNRVTFGPMQFDLALGELTHNGRRVSLTDAEIALLRALGSRLGEVLSRETLRRRGEGVLEVILEDDNLSGDGAARFGDTVEMRELAINCGLGRRIPGYGSAVHHTRIAGGPADNLRVGPQLRGAVGTHRLRD